MTDPVDDGRERRRQFVRTHRTAVFGYQRKRDGPSMSLVYYVMDEDEQILVSTMRDRAKAKAIERDPRVALCVLDEQWPPSYLQVYCSASVDPDFERAVDLMLRMSELMAGHTMPDSARSDVEDMVRAESRVVLTLKPYATFQTPPSARLSSVRHQGDHTLDERELAMVRPLLRPPRTARDTQGTA